MGCQSVHGLEEASERIRTYRTMAHEVMQHARKAAITDINAVRLEPLGKGLAHITQRIALRRKDIYGWQG